jgi:hypothetical protein
MKNNHKSNLVRAARSPSASATVELVCGIILLLPVALLALNICFICLGSFINDSACREAARVASQQTTVDGAVAAAGAAVRSFAIAGGLISSPTIDGVVYTFYTDPNDPENKPISIPELSYKVDADGKPITNVSKGPFAQVITTLVAQAPAPLLFSESGVVQRVVLKNSSTFPLLIGIDTDPTDVDDIFGDDGPIPTSDP